MDANVSATGTAVQPSSLAGSPSLSASYDPVIDYSMKNGTTDVDDNKIGSSVSSDGGFESGEEEFETALERPLVGYPDEEAVEKIDKGDESDAAPFVDSLEFPKSASATVDVVEANDDDENVVGDSKGRVLAEESFGNGRKGLEVVGDEDYVAKTEIGGVGIEGEEEPQKLEVEGIDVNQREIVGEPENKVVVDDMSVEAEKASGGLEDGKVLGGGANKGDSVSVELANDKVESDGGGDSVVQTGHVNVVRDVVDRKDSEIVGNGVPVDRSVNIDNGFDHQINHGVELVDSNTESDKNVDSLTRYEVEKGEVEGKGDDIEIGNNTKSNIDAVATETSVANGQDGVNFQSSPNDSETLGVIYNKEKQMTEVDIQTKLVEPTVETADDQLDLLSTDKVEIDNGAGIQVVDSFAATAQTQTPYEAEQIRKDWTYVGDQNENLEDRVPCQQQSTESTDLSAVSNKEIELEVEDEEGDIDGSVTDGETEGMIFGSSQAAKQFLEELERGSGVDSHSGAESSHDHSHRIDGQIVTDSDEEVDTDEEGEEKELFDSATLAALLKAATGADSDGGGSVTITSQDGSRLFSVERPAGLGSSLRAVKPGPRPNRPSLFTHSGLTTGGEPVNNLSEEEKKKLEKLQQIRVKFLRLLWRLGHSSEDSIAAQVLYRLALVAGRQTGQLFSLDAAKMSAQQLEAEGNDDLNFSLNILVLGKTGVGKSATINAIFGEEKVLIDAFEPATKDVKEIVGTLDGVKIRVIDTPGLKPSGVEQGSNRRVLSSIKRFAKKCPPDIVLYVDRLDTQTRDLNDLPLLKSITNALGSSIWRNAIVTLTHAASAPPDGPSGSPLSYEVFVAQRSHVVQQSIGQAVGDLRLMNPSLMNPVSLVENHPNCRKNRDGHKVLPNGQTWKPQLLLLCYSMKILSEASSLSKSQDPFDNKKLFGFRVRSPPLPYLLSWLLQSRPHPKLTTNQGSENVDSDVELADLSDSDQEEDEDEYDQLPPFKPLKKSQIAMLNKEQRKAYFEEYDYRVKLLQKKQWREELRRMREIKKNGNTAANQDDYNGEDVDPENGPPAAVSVPLPDMVLPATFDGDNPAFRYRFLEPTSQFLARPVLDTHGWDHDCGYDGVNLEHNLAIVSRFPAAVAVQVTKDKKEFNIHFDSSVSVKHGENGSSMAGFDIQNVGKQLAYIVRGDTKFKHFKRHKTAAGVSVTFLGENVATGVKIEDQVALGKRFMLVGSTGTVRCRGDSAYGANLEVRLRDPDFPIGQDQSSLGLSLVKWRGDLALGANLQSQVSIGRSSKIAVRAGLNNKLSGQITVRTSTSDQLQIALVGLLPVAMAIYKIIHPGISENYSSY